MANNLAKAIKNQIKKDLDTLVSGGSLSACVELDFSKDALDDIYTGYPVAILGMASLESDAYDNQDNLRTYIFPMMIVQKVGNLVSPTDMEDLRDAIVNAFDTDYTLAGNAVGGVLPATTPPEKSTPDKGLIYFLITLKCKALYQLGT